MSCEEGQDGVHTDSGMLLLQQLGEGSGMGCRDHTTRFFIILGDGGMSPAPPHQGNQWQEAPRPVMGLAQAPGSGADLPAPSGSVHHVCHSHPHLPVPSSHLVLYDLNCDFFKFILTNK